MEYVKMLLNEIIQLPNIQPTDSGIRGARYVNVEPGGAPHPPRLKVYLFGEPNSRNITFKVREVGNQYDTKLKRTLKVYCLDNDNAIDNLDTLSNRKTKKDVITFIKTNVNVISQFWFNIIDKKTMEDRIKPAT